MKISRKSVRDNFDKPTSTYFTIVNDVLAAATIISILAIVLETVPALNTYHAVFVFIEWTAVVLFSVEYVFAVLVYPETYGVCPQSVWSD